MRSQGRGGACLYGILVTYRRHELLSQYLSSLEKQTRPLDRLVVVDNEGSSEVAEAVARYNAKGHAASYVAAADNLGPAGGIALGMQRVLQDASDDDWLVLLDDDDPLGSPGLLSELWSFADEMRRLDHMTAGVGISGGRFDWRRGRLIEVPDRELVGGVPVDGVASNQFPLYRVGAVRDVGVFSANLFFGFDHLEYGLRLRRAGYRFYACGHLWLEGRERTGRLDRPVRPALGLGDPSWRRYYSLRNLIHILRRYGRPGTALWIVIARGVAKPVVALPFEPRLAWQHLRLNARACRDGWFGRMGRTIEPVTAYE